jgi:putative flippase GtrA
LPFSFIYHRCRYCRYFVIGAIVGVLAIVAREAIMILLAKDTPAYYAGSVVVVYVGGILASYFGHHWITFGDIERSRSTAQALGRFAVIAVFGLVMTTLLSLFFRYAVPVTGVAEKFKPTLAFVAAALITSVATFLLNSTFTFTRMQQSTKKMDDVRGGRA